MKRITGLLLTGIWIFASACRGIALADVPTPAANAPLPPLETATPTQTDSATQTAASTPTEASVWQGPGEVIAPIILYHRIDVSPIGSRYYVPPGQFEAQLKLLRDWGYTTIPTQALVDAIQHGAPLPPHPILITFDDGNLDNYVNAFPLMQKYGFTGVLYVVGRYLGAPGYLTADQVREMVAAGWEVGSHGMSHANLTALDPQALRSELVDSRALLEERIGVPALTVAYPFGSSNRAVMDYAYFAGYIGGMGLGSQPKQNERLLFALQRREIQASYDVITFASFLPWQGDPAYLPTLTSTPTPVPTRTRVPTRTAAP